MWKLAPLLLAELSLQKGRETMAAADDKAEPLRPDSPVHVVMVDVTAPATLPAGYEFDAQVDGGDPELTVHAVVPEGGVREGDVFQVPMEKRVASSGRLRIKAPKGRWKDGLCGCFNYGCCHASLCCAICCPYILMAQVMTRMRLTWLGEYSNSRSKKSTYRKVVCVVFTYIIIIVGLTIVEQIGVLKYVPGEWKYRLKNTYIPVIKTISFVFFSLWALYSLCMTRESVRVRYSIRQKPYYCGCEDLCCSAFCPCLTAAQLARHTGEYETYPGACCTETGHPRGTPRL